MPGLPQPIIAFISRLKEAWKRRRQNNSISSEKSSLDSHKLLAFWLSKLQDRRWTGRRQIYAAAGLSLVAAVLMIVVIDGITARDNPPSGLKADTQAAVIEPVLPANKAPAAVNPAIEPKPDAKASLPDSPVKEPESGAKVKAVTEQEIKTFLPAVEGRPVRPVGGEPKLEFGWHQHPVFGDWRFHAGLDLSAAEGTAVKALWDGKVIDIVNDRHTGLTVIVAGAKYTVYYGSLSKVFVEKNAYIRAGSKIGAAGTSAAEPTPHLHIGIKQGSDYINPRDVLDIPG